jgi:hypothetical protein
MPRKATRPVVRYRSAITGRFVSRVYAEANPDTTIAHSITTKEVASEDQ